LPEGWRVIGKRSVVLDTDRYNSVALARKEPPVDRQSSFAFKAFVSTVLAWLVAAPAGSAAPITFTGGSGNLAATVKFDNDGAGNLVVTLTNTSTVDEDTRADVLTALFFDSSVALTLTRVSAELNTAGSGSEVIGNGGLTRPTPLGVGGEWAYKPVSGPHDTDYGISSVDLGSLFGAGDRFITTDGFNLQGADSPGGVDFGVEYGIVGTAFNPADDAVGLAGRGVIKNSVVFKLSGISDTFDPSTIISNVWFQYGTALTDPHVEGLPPGGRVVAVPVPPSLVLMGLGGIGLVARRFRRRLTVGEAV
jgi:hypothetical protein